MPSHLRQSFPLFSKFPHVCWAVCGFLLWLTTPHTAYLHQLIFLELFSLLLPSSPDSALCHCFFLLIVVSCHICCVLPSFLLCGEAPSLIIFAFSLVDYDVKFWQLVFFCNIFSIGLLFLFYSFFLLPPCFCLYLVGWCVAASRESHLESRISSTMIFLWGNWFFFYIFCLTWMNSTNCVWEFWCGGNLSSHAICCKGRILVPFRWRKMSISVMHLTCLFSCLGKLSCVDIFSGK